MIGTFFEGETAILVASSLIHQGFFEGPYTVVFAFAGSFVSDWIYFIVGRVNGKYFVARRPKLRDKIKPVQHFFERNKIQILFSYRFLYGFRILIPVIIGMSNLRPLHYLFYSLVSGLIWATVVSMVGYFIGRFLNLNATAFQENILFIVLGFACFGMLLGYVVKKITYREMGVPETETEP